MNLVRLLSFGLNAAVFFALLPAFVQAQTSFFWTNNAANSQALTMKMSSDGAWTNNLGTTNAPQSGGSNSYVLNFSNSQNNWISNDLGNASSGGFLLNSLGGSRQVTIYPDTSYGALVFMTNSAGGTPTIQGGGYFTIYNDIILSNDLSIATSGNGKNYFYGLVSGSYDITNGMKAWGGSNYLQVTNPNNSFAGTWVVTPHNHNIFTSDSAIGAGVAKVNVQSGGQVTFTTDTTIGGGIGRITVNDGGGIRASNGTMSSMNAGAGGNLVLNPGAMLIYNATNNTTPAGLSTSNSYVYGLSMNMTNLTNVVIGQSASVTNYRGIGVGAGITAALGTTNGKLALNGNAEFNALFGGTLNISNKVTGGNTANTLNFRGGGTVSLKNSGNDFASMIAGGGLCGVSFGYASGSHSYTMADGFNTFGKLSAPNGINLTLTAGPGSTNYFGFQSTVILGGSAALGGLGGGGTTIFSGGTWSNFNGNADGVLSGSGNTLGYTNAVVSFMCGNGAGGGYGSLTLGTGNRLLIRSDTVATFGTANGLHIDGGAVLVENGGIITNSYISVAGSDSGSLIITNGGYVQASAVRMGDSQKSNYVYVGSPGGSACSILNAAKIQPGGDDTGGAGTNNYVIVDKGGVITNSQFFVGIGKNSSGNYMQISSGGKAYANSDAYVGGYSLAKSNCNDNYILITGSGSLVSMAGKAIYLGYVNNATGNYLQVDAGGMLTNAGSIYVGYGTNANYNSVLLKAGSLLELTNLVVGRLSGLSAGNIFTNTGGILQFTINSPSIAANAGNTVVINSGTLSYHNVSNVNFTNNWGTTGVGAFTWLGNNTLRLDNTTATNSLAVPYVVANNLGPTNYAGLELVNGTTVIRGLGIAVDGNNGGSLMFSNTTASITGGIALAGAVTFTVGGDSSLTGTVSGSGALIKTGAGSLTLNSTNTYSGPTTISAGRLALSGPAVLGSSGSYAAAVTNNGSLVYSGSATQTLSGVISGTGSVTRAGSGLLILGSSNTWSGATIITNGTLRLTVTNCFSPNTSVYIYSGGTNDLAFTGTNMITALYINGVLQPMGVYGTNTAGMTGCLTGTGHLKTTSPPDGLRFDPATTNVSIFISNAATGTTYTIWGFNSNLANSATALYQASNVTFFTFIDTNALASTDRRFYRMTETTSGIVSTNSWVYTAFRKQLDPGTWDKFAPGIDYGSSNTLNSTLGSQLVQGLTSNNTAASADLFYLMTSQGGWAMCYPNAGGTWCDYYSGLATNTQVQPWQSFWIKRRCSGGTTYPTYAGYCFTNASPVTFRSNDWHMITWPLALDRKESDGPQQGWGFAAAGAQKGTSWLNSDLLTVGDGSALRFYYLHTSGRWCAAGQTTPAASVNLHVGDAYYYMHRGTGFTWTATAP